MENFVNSDNLNFEGQFIHVVTLDFMGEEHATRCLEAPAGSFL